MLHWIRKLFYPSSPRQPEQPPEAIVRLSATLQAHLIRQGYAVEIIGAANRLMVQDQLEIALGARKDAAPLSVYIIAMPWPMAGLEDYINADLRGHGTTMSEQVETIATQYMKGVFPALSKAFLAQQPDDTLTSFWGGTMHWQVFTLRDILPDEYRILRPLVVEKLRDEPVNWLVITHSTSEGYQCFWNNFHWQAADNLLLPLNQVDKSTDFCQCYIFKRTDMLPDKF